MNRRGFITGLGSGLFLAPAIVRASSLMPIHAAEFDLDAWTRAHWKIHMDMARRWTAQVYAESPITTMLRAQGLA